MESEPVRMTIPVTDCKGATAADHPAQERAGSGTRTLTSVRGAAVGTRPLAESSTITAVHKTAATAAARYTCDTADGRAGQPSPEASRGAVTRCCHQPGLVLAARTWTVARAAFQPYRPAHTALLYDSRAYAWSVRQKRVLRVICREQQARTIAGRRVANHATQAIRPMPGGQRRGGIVVRPVKNQT